MHVIPGLGAGGAEAMLANLVCAERPGAPEAIVVNLLAAVETSEPGERISAHGATVIDLGIRWPIGFAAAVWRLASLIRRFKPDVVQGWMYYGDLAGTLGLMLSGRRKKTRLCWGVRCSNMDTSQYGAALRYAIALCRRFSHRPDRIVANSEAGRAVHCRLGYRADRFTVIDNGIDTGRFRPDDEARRRVRAGLGIGDGDIVAIYPARLDPQKDHDTFVAAVFAVTEVTFLAVGRDTESLADLPNLHRLGLRRDMPALYAASDLLVNSSAFGEGFANVIGEGMACGLIPIATDVGDAARIVGGTGTIVPPRAPKTLAEAIRAAAALPPSERDARGRAARQRIEVAFSLERAVAAFDALHKGEHPAPEPAGAAA